MSETFVQVPPDSSGKRLRALGRTAGGLSGLLEEVMIAETYGHLKANVSGAVVSNVVSGNVLLHTIVVNDYTSGLSFRVRDCCSGAGGTIIGATYAGTRALIPTTLIFNCVMLSGIVIDTSGATWNLTVTYRPTLW